MEQGYLGRGLLRMGSGFGWTLPLIWSNARIRRRRSGQFEEEPPSCDRSTGSPAKKQSMKMGSTFWSSPSEDLSCHFDPSLLGRGLHHHDEVVGRWCSICLTAGGVLGRGLLVHLPRSGKLNRKMIACESNRWSFERFFFFFWKNIFCNPTYDVTKLVLKFEKCSKLDFQKLKKKYSLKNYQVRFFNHIIIFPSTKMLAHIADIRLCAFIPANLNLCFHIGVRF